MPSSLTYHRSVYMASTMCRGSPSEPGTNQNQQNDVRFATVNSSSPGGQLKNRLWGAQSVRGHNPTLRDFLHANATTVVRASPSICRLFVLTTVCTALYVQIRSGGSTNCSPHLLIITSRPVLYWRRCIPSLPNPSTSGSSGSSHMHRTAGANNLLFELYHLSWSSRLFRYSARCQRATRKSLRFIGYAYMRF